MDVEESSGLDPGLEVRQEPETDRFGFLVTNGSSARSGGPSAELVRQREAKWISIISHWDYMLMKRSNKVRLQCQKGIPASLRAKCWPLLCGATEKMKQNHTLYKLLDSQPGSPSWEDVIRRDLDRQFPFHEMFLSKDGHGQRGLFQVLKAYTQYQPEEGYCQAQGPVAAVLLMNMPAEEAFWCLVQISKQYLPGYYSPLLEGVLFDAAMLTWLLKKTCPPAHKHLQHYCVEPLMFATDWLMCLFARHLPFNTLLRVWDLFFYHGVQVLLQVAVVLVRRVLGRPEQRKECQGQMETLERLRGIRDVIGEEDDAFITEVCSVPLSARDLEKKTQKEYEKWKRDKPSSNFDPRSRCQGHQLARPQQIEKERDAAERATANPSAALSRSASTLSLPSALLYSRWRKMGSPKKSQGGKKVSRHFSMRVEDSSPGLDFEKLHEVEEERKKAWHEIKHFRQTQRDEETTGMTHKTASTESVTLQEGAEKIGLGEHEEAEESQSLTNQIGDGETKDQSEVMVGNNPENKEEESDVRDGSGGTDEQSVESEADQQDTDRTIPEEAESETNALQDVQGTVESKGDVELETPDEQTLHMNPIQTASERNPDCDTVVEASSTREQNFSAAKEMSINDEEGITDQEAGARERQYHSTDSSVDVEQTDEARDQRKTETGSLAPTQERMAENAAPQDEPKRDLEQTAEQEPLMSPPERTEQKEEELDDEPALEAQKDSIKDDENREIIFTIHEDAKAEGGVCNDAPSESNTVDHVPESPTDQSSCTPTDSTGDPHLGKEIQVDGTSCKCQKDSLEGDKVHQTESSGPPGSLSSGDSPVRRSSSFLGSRLEQQLSENRALSAHNPDPTNSQSSDAPAHTGDAVVEEKPPSTRSKRFGHLLRGLRGEHSKDSKRKDPPKIKVPTILIQDFSDVMESPEAGEGEEVKSIEQRTQQKEHRTGEEGQEERRQRKSSDREMKKEEKERKKRAKRLKEQKKKGGTTVVHLAPSDSHTLRYSTSHAESYF